MAEPVSEPATAPVAFKRPGKKRGKRILRFDDSDEDDAVIKKQSRQLKGAIRVTSKPEGDDKRLEEVYAGSGQIRDNGDMGATRNLEENTEHDRDQRAQREAFMSDTAREEGKYAGMKGYKDWKQGLRRENEVPIHGPQRVSNFVRTTIRIDYQPDICKDYKETGFCSYGDSCKFLHDRGDYKQGWELDREWEAQQKRIREKAQNRVLEGRDPDESTEGEDSDDEELPFACFICRRRWEECESEPVKTECMHYFCEKCALEHDRKGQRCAVCEKDTHGVFNIADEIIVKYKVKEKVKKRAGGLGWAGWSTEEPDEQAGQKSGGGWEAE